MVRHVFDHPLPEPVDNDVRIAYYEKSKRALARLQTGEVTFEDIREDIKPQPWHEWYNQWDAPYLEVQTRDTVAYITRAFNSIDQIAENYSDSQMNQGICYIINNGCSDYIFSLIDASVPENQRIAAVYSFYSIYKKLYDKKCQSDLGHLDEERNPLNRTCYMWFDVLPLYGKSGIPERDVLDDHILSVMEKIVQLPNQACQEGALHGLGHWQYAYPDRVAQIIDEYLAKKADELREELAQYARHARIGYVL